MTPQEALTEGVKFVDEIAAGEGPMGTAADRASAAIAVACFILDYSDRGAEGDDLDPDAPTVPVGPAHQVDCEMSPGDYMHARAGKVGGKAVVCLQAFADGEGVSVFLSPTRARQYAAGILNAADEAEGSSPLLSGVLKLTGDDGDAPTPANA